MNTLLEKAKTVASHSKAPKIPLTDEVCELIIAYWRGEIDQSQAIRALDLKSTFTSTFMGLEIKVIKDLLKKGRLILK